MSLSVWFHIYADGEWREPLDEFLTALSDYDGIINFGVVGTPAARCDVGGWLLNRGVAAKIVAEADEGYEQVTLLPLAKAVKKMGGNVLYAHTKGASDQSELNVLWRRAMLGLVVRDRKFCESEIYKRGYDAVGTNFLTPEEYQGIVTSPFFGGNFWVATARYLRTLPTPPTRTRDNHGRFDAESWIGSGARRPFVLDRLPGFPSVELFRRAKEIADG